ncbi:MAG: FAD-binding oxidoreductase [Pseudomonadota bacterium]
MSDDLTVDVTIVGAGIVGICSALSLLERGFSVRMIDRGEPGQETSFGNAGVISPWSFIPQSLPGVWRNIPAWLLNQDGPLRFHMSVLPKLLPWFFRFYKNCNPDDAQRISDSMEILTASSVDLFKKHLKGTGHENLIADAMYVHAFRNPKKANLNSIDYKIRREKGADIRMIGAQELREIEPALSPDFSAAILIKGQSRALAPGKIGFVLSEKARKSGAIFVKSEVEKLVSQVSGGWCVRASSGDFLSKKVLVSAGAWSTKLLESLGFRVPLMAERGYHIQLPEPQLSLNNSVMDVENKIVASSMLDGLRVAGTSEFAPIEAPPDEKRFESLQRLTQRMLPDVNLERKTTWMGCRPSFPDSLPIIGRLPISEGLYGAFGHSHYGLMMAPKTGELVAELISGTNSNYDISAFSAERFD